MGVGRRDKVRLGVTLAWVAVLGACGSRNALPGGLAVDEDDGDPSSVVGGSNSGSGGNSSGPGGDSARAAFAAGLVSGVVSTSGGMAVSQASASFGSGVSTTGFGGGANCDWAVYTGGQGGEAGAPSSPTSCPIYFCDGWAPGAGNCANIQGGFYVFSDEVNGGGSTVELTTSENNLLCVSGEVGRVFDGQYDVYWGAGFGMSLNQPELNAEREPYDAEQQGVDGFSFWIDGSTYGGELRFTVRGEDDYYCESVYPTQGYHEFWLADLIKGCWAPVSTAHDYSRLLSLEWNFVSNASSNYRFEVCMTDLSVLRRP